MPDFKLNHHIYREECWGDFISHGVSQVLISPQLPGHQSFEELQYRIKGQILEKIKNYNRHHLPLPQRIPLILLNLQLNRDNFYTYLNKQLYGYPNLLSLLIDPGYCSTLGISAEEIWFIAAISDNNKAQGNKNGVISALIKELTQSAAFQTYCDKLTLMKDLGRIQKKILTQKL